MNPDNRTDPYLELASLAMGLTQEQKAHEYNVRQGLRDRWSMDQHQWKDLVDTLIVHTKPFKHLGQDRTLHAFGRFNPETPDDWLAIVIRALPKQPVIRPPLYNPDDDAATRLANANQHFNLKAAEVLADEKAVDLLESISKELVVKAEHFDFNRKELALARLAAADFVTIRNNTVGITHNGQRFIETVTHLPPEPDSG